MSRVEVKKPVCGDCQHHVRPLGGEPQPCNGAMLLPGLRYCVGGKRPRRFWAKDPKVYVPDWCPKRKTPCELRVYGFASRRDWEMHTALCAGIGQPIMPEARRYALEYELKTKLSPAEFWKRCRQETDADLLHVAVHRYHVVEIDDGLKPFCFYKTEKGYLVVTSFDTKTARGNLKEDAFD